VGGKRTYEIMDHSEADRVFDPSRHFRLDAKVCLITGGGNGIGRAIALAAGASGATVHVLDRDAGAGARVSVELAQRNSKGVHHILDVTDEGAVETTFQKIAASGGIDVLVNNAGLAIRKPALELTREDWQRVVDVNLTGLFLCARAAARHMGARGGSIVNMASIMGLSGGGLYPNISYQATKGAVVNLTRALAVEWAPQQIRVNAIAPTWVRTEFIRPILDDPALIDRIHGMTPLRQIAEPADIAAAAIYLASPAARMVTGHILAVDGGFLAQ
jgi:NAD(P)-dependent dehydrogenase (short-subunit alcohol dehydrogenase family)